MEIIIKIVLTAWVLNIGIFLISMTIYAYKEYKSYILDKVIKTNMLSLFCTSFLLLIILLVSLWVN